MFHLVQFFLHFPIFECSYISQVSNEASSSATSWKRVSTEETDNVFTDDGNFEETGTNIEPVNAAVKDQFVVSNPWKEDVTGTDFKGYFLVIRFLHVQWVPKV